MKFLLGVIYFFFEIFFIVEFANEFGIFSLFLEIILSAIFGFGLLLSQISRLSIAFNEIFSGGIGSFLGRNFFRLFGGIILIIPGILCDIVGIVFVVISLFFRAPNATRYTQESKTDDTSDIIDVEIIEDKK